MTTRAKEPLKKKSRLATEASETKWKTSVQQMSRGSPTPLADCHPELITKSPTELFDMTDTEQMFENLKQQFELYAHRDANSPGFTTTVDDDRQSVGILLLSGYHCPTCERGYCSTAVELGCSPVMKTISRSRFHELKWFCHMADNQALSASEVAKIQHKHLYYNLVSLSEWVSEWVSSCLTAHQHI